jgi:hypothetical protein
LFGSEGKDPRAQDAARDWQRRFGREGHEGSYAQQHDEAYQRYRQRHIEELDADYAEWCRTHEQGFHRDFEDFRSRRKAASGMRPGDSMTNAPGDGGTVDEDRRADTLVADQNEGGIR